MGDPVIYKARKEYAIGDRLEINCTSFQSRPAAKLQWLVNGKLINSSNQVDFPIAAEPNQSTNLHQRDNWQFYGHWHIPTRLRLRFHYQEPSSFIKFGLICISGPIAQWKWSIKSNHGNAVVMNVNIHGGGSDLRIMVSSPIVTTVFFLSYPIIKVYLLLVTWTMIGVRVRWSNSSLRSFLNWISSNGIRLNNDVTVMWRCFNYWASN